MITDWILNIIKITDGIRFLFKNGLCLTKSQDCDICKAYFMVKCIRQENEKKFVLDGFLDAAQQLLKYLSDSRKS